MTEHQVLLVNAPFEPDPDAAKELGPDEAEAIADEDLQGSRLLLVRRAAEGIVLDNTPGGAVELSCTFQPARGTRFIWARLLLRLTTPEGVKIVDVAPREVREDEPVRLTIDGKGKLGLSYQMVEAGVEASVRKEFAIYHCGVRGSGEATALARWDFNENPDKKDGLGTEQALALTLPLTGQVTGQVSVSARLARCGLLGRLDAVRDLILHSSRGARDYSVTFETAFNYNIS